jgi:hypothetical protein
MGSREQNTERFGHQSIENSKNFKRPVRSNMQRGRRERLLQERRYLPTIEKCRSENKKEQTSWGWWLTPLILAAQEAEIRRWRFKASLGKQFTRPYLENTYHKTELMEWEERKVGRKRGERGKGGREGGRKERKKEGGERKDGGKNEGRKERKGKERKKNEGGERERGRKKKEGRKEREKERKKEGKKEGRKDRREKEGRKGKEGKDRRQKKRGKEKREERERKTERRKEGRANTWQWR